MEGFPSQEPGQPRVSQSASKRGNNRGPASVKTTWGSGGLPPTRPSPQSRAEGTGRQRSTGVSFYSVLLLLPVRNCKYITGVLTEKEQPRYGSCIVPTNQDTKIPLIISPRSPSHCEFRFPHPPVLPPHFSFLRRRGGDILIPPGESSLITHRATELPSCKTSPVSSNSPSYTRNF